ncbi:hypothetical protein PM082_001785 [Marasmius tenuissimus]|nr:hypothetical protein PM082_001785 [Marasmius tenuissimus]
MSHSSSEGCGKTCYNRGYWRTKRVFPWFLYFSVLNHSAWGNATRSLETFRAVSNQLEDFQASNRMSTLNARLLQCFSFIAHEPAVDWGRGMLGNAKYFRTTAKLAECAQTS